MSKQLKPILPGEILLEEFLNPFKISQNKFARDIDVPVARVNEIIKGKRSITTDTALRFAVYFSTTPEFWINLQNNYDLKIAKKKLLPKITSSVRPLERKVA
jgi:addiction module HigA family antidote